MNKTEMKENWDKQKAKLKMKFAMLTDKDLIFEEGKKDEMLGRLQKKMGKTTEEFQKIMESL